MAGLFHHGRSRAQCEQRFGTRALCGNGTKAPDKWKNRIIVTACTKFRGATPRAAQWSRCAEMGGHDRRNTQPPAVDDNWSHPVGDEITHKQCTSKVLLTKLFVSGVWPMQEQNGAPGLKI